MRTQKEIERRIKRLDKKRLYSCAFDLGARVEELEWVLGSKPRHAIIRKEETKAMRDYLKERLGVGK